MTDYMIKCKDIYEYIVKKIYPLHLQHIYSEV